MGLLAFNFGRSRFAADGQPGDGRSDAAAALNDGYHHIPHLLGCLRAHDIGGPQSVWFLTHNITGWAFDPEQEVRDGDAAVVDDGTDNQSHIQRRG